MHRGERLRSRRAAALSGEWRIVGAGDRTAGKKEKKGELLDVARDVDLRACHRPVRLIITMAKLTGPDGRSASVPENIASNTNPDGLFYAG